MTQAPTSTVPAVAIDIAGHAAKPTPYSIELPGPSRVWSVTISPSGDRLAWVLSREREYSIYISDIHGKHWKLIGSFDQHSAGYADRLSWPTGLRWLPAGRSISYVIDTDLYRVDVPK